MNAFLQDLRFGLRSLRKMPLLSFAALACIAIGVAATISVFTLINTALLQRLPYPDADRLVRVWGTRGTEEPRRDLSFANFEDLRDGARSLETLEAAARTRLSIIGETGVERTRGESVTPGYFQMIGVRPELGRLFAPAEYSADSSLLVVIGYDLWQRRFGGSRDVVGSLLEARGSWGGQETTNRSYEVIGVMPQSFTGTIEDDVSEFWLPIAHYVPQANLERRNRRILWTIGKLNDGASVDAAGQEVEALGRTLAADHPDDNRAFGARVEKLGENWREDLRGGLYLLLGAYLLLLLIACTNIANLLLARLARRERELTLRMVMGAGRWRVLNQLLTESLVLAIVGGGIGIALAYGFVHVYLQMAADDIPSYVQVAVDLRVVALSLLVVLATGVLFGVLPAWLGSRVEAGGELKESGRGSSGGQRQRRLGRLLVAGEVALTLVLLVGAFLMFRSYRALETHDLGYDVAGMLRMSSTLDRTVYPEAADWARLRREVEEELRGYPGVVSVASAGGVLPPASEAELGLTHPALDGEEVSVERHLAGPGLMETLGIRRLHGRDLSLRDLPDGPRVALISESLARRLGGGDARSVVGEPVRFVIPSSPPRTSDPYEVVGVVEDVLYDGPLTERPHDFDVYLSIDQVADYLVSFAIRTSGSPASFKEPLTRIVGQRVMPSPVHWVQTLEEMVEERYSDTRFYTMLIIVYSLSAVLLAIIGIYGVLADSVQRRFRELGIRVAVGAGQRELIRMVVRQSMITVGLGIAVGVTVALAAGRVIGSLLFGVTPTDPLTFVVVVAAMLVLALAASYLPARQATRVDPVVALRDE